MQTAVAARWGVDEVSVDSVRCVPEFGNDGATEGAETLPPSPAPPAPPSALFSMVVAVSLLI